MSICCYSRYKSSDCIDLVIKRDPGHSISYKITCATIEVSDQPVHETDQSLRCPPEDTWDPRLPIDNPAKTLIIPRGCTGWSQSMLGACNLVGNDVPRSNYYSNRTPVSILPADTQRRSNVDSTLIQHIDVKSSLNRRCFNVVCLLGYNMPTNNIVCTRGSQQMCALWAGPK